MISGFEHLEPPTAVIMVRDLSQLVKRAEGEHGVLDRWLRMAHLRYHSVPESTGEVAVGARYSPSAEEVELSLLEYDLEARIRSQSGHDRAPLRRLACLMQFSTREWNRGVTITGTAGSGTSATRWLCLVALDSTDPIICQISRDGRVCVTSQITCK